MTISVVIPAYNEEKFLPRTIDSLWKLDRKPDEIIVIDGKSTDGTAKVAKGKNAIVETVEHRGIGYARQIGLEKAKGDIVAFTDADTEVPYDWLSKIEKSLLKPNVSCVYGIYRVPDGPLAYRVFINFIQPTLNLILSWFGIPMAPGQNIAFWKEKAMQVGGFPKNFKIAEDIEIARRLKTVGKVVFNKNLVVISSGRRGNEGIGIIPRYIKANYYYLLQHRADVVGFPDIR
ncbi:glycosyltransferase [Candidatus Gottesmanbacteria bacterium]|nr:glycosyltransferase [Candidatus Gottesmanbacteria bacterium]